MERITRAVVPPLLLLVFVFVIWETCVYFLEIPPVTLPRPTRVLTALWERRDTLLMCTAYTSIATMTGLACSVTLGVLLAAVFSQAAVIRRSCFPYAIFLQTVPIVAIAPLLISWFGSGLQTVILIVVIISLFPIVVNTTAGMVSVDRQLVELFQLNGASRLQIFLHLQLPNSVPMLISATKTSSGLAVIGAIVGEFFAGHNGRQTGLGSIIQKWYELLQIDAMMAAVLMSALLGIVVFTLVSVLESKVLARFGQVQSRVFQ